MPSLRELDAKFLQREVREGRTYHLTQDITLENAHGLQFLCPKCFEENKGPVGTHSVICWFEDKVPEDAYPGPGMQPGLET